MKKSNVWACSDPNCHADHAKEICPTLEKLLPQMRDGDPPKYISDAAVAAMTVSVFQSHFWKFDEARFLTLMRNYGITEKWDLDLLSAKYFRNLSPDDIVKEFHYVRRDTVYRRLKALRALLKERGIEQELSSWQPEKK